MLIDLLQTNLIYFPDRDYHATPDEIGLVYEQISLRTEDGVEIAAWYIKSNQDKGSLIFCHGNGGNISNRLDAYQPITVMGYNVLAFDYRGYGQSKGKPSEAGTYLDAEAAWDYLVETRREDPKRIAVFGESLGGAVAIELALRHQPAALVAESTFTSLVDIGKLHYSLLPVNWILRHRYESIDKVGKIACPKLFIHAADDTLIPIENARRLYEAAAQPKTFIETPGEHNSGGFRYAPEFAEQVRAFLDRHIASPAESDR